MSNKVDDAFVKSYNEMGNSGVMVNGYSDTTGMATSEKRVAVFNGVTSSDNRYNIPKQPPVVSDDVVTKVISKTEIYNTLKQLIVDKLQSNGDPLYNAARDHILNAQRKQVAYGIAKYPEPLTADSWDVGETIQHIVDESIDKLHYLIMLKIKLAGITPTKFIDDMIHTTVIHLHTLIMVRITFENMSEIICIKRNDF